MFKGKNKKKTDLKEEISVKEEIVVEKEELVEEETPTPRERLKQTEIFIDEYLIIKKDAIYANDGKTLLNPTQVYNTLIQMSRDFLVDENEINEDGE